MERCAGVAGQVPNAVQKMAAEGTTLSGYYEPYLHADSFLVHDGPVPDPFGLQHGVIEDAVPEHVPINETMVPEYMRKQGYKTHIVGKWHLGFRRKSTPKHVGLTPILAIQSATKNTGTIPVRAGTAATSRRSVPSPCDERSFQPM